MVRISILALIVGFVGFILTFIFAALDIMVIADILHWISWLSFACGGLGLLVAPESTPFKY